jgi:uncharacterized membrane protein
VSLANEKETPSGGSPKFVFVVLIVAAFLVLLPLVLNKKENTGYTEFYFQESQDENSAWLLTYPLGASIPINLIVNNRELNPTRYFIQLYTDQSVAGYVDLGVVPPGQNVTQQLVLPPLAETNTRYEFILYKNGLDTPYRILNLWIRRGNE